MTIAVHLDAANFSQPWTGSLDGMSQTANEIRARLGRPSLDPEYRQIAELMIRPDVQPSENAVRNASFFLQNLSSRATRLSSWSSPHMTLSETGEIVFEWWQNARKITLYFGNGEPEYIKVWGTDVETEMESGILTNDWSLTAIWLWLHS